MLRVYARPFTEASELIGQLMHVLNDPQIDRFAEQTRDHLTAVLDRLIEQLQAMELTMTLYAAGRLRDHLWIPDITARQCRDYLIQLRDRMPDELETTYLLSLTAKEKALYEPSVPLFGTRVQTDFPSAIDDIEEAAKCMAFGRSTASAFHSMRVIEIAIRAVARCLNIPDPIKPADRNWGVVLKAIKDEIDRRWPARARQSGDGRIFEDLYATLDAMKNPWRNATMHVEAVYTSENAEAIFQAVGAFMRKLADRCDELGMPVA